MTHTLTPTRSAMVLSGVLSGFLLACLLTGGCSKRAHHSDQADRVDTSLVKFDQWMPGKPIRSDRVPLFSEIIDPVILFDASCVGCHGADGQFGPAPPLNDPLFLSIFSQEEMLTLLRQGRPGSLMPSFGREHRGGLSDEQRDALVAGVYRRWAVSEGLPTGTPPYQAATKGDAAAGREKFAIYCAECHGPQGAGGKHGRLNEPAFLSLVSDQLLRRIMITGRHDLGMPNFVGIGKQSSTGEVLTGQDISDIVALLGTWRTPPATASENQPESAALSGSAQRTPGENR